MVAMEMKISNLKLLFSNQFEMTVSSNISEQAHHYVRMLDSKDEFPIVNK
jgi:hypothetical protein